MMRDKIHIFISIGAALIMTVLCIVLKTPLMQSLVELVLTILVFYMLGAIAQYYINTKIFPPRFVELVEAGAEEEEDDDSGDDAGTEDENEATYAEIAADYEED